MIPYHTIAGVLGLKLFDQLAARSLRSIRVALGDLIRGEMAHGPRLAVLVLDKALFLHLVPFNVVKVALVDRFASGFAGGKWMGVEAVRIESNCHERVCIFI